MTTGLRASLVSELARHRRTLRADGRLTLCLCGAWYEDINEHLADAILPVLGQPAGPGDGDEWLRCSGLHCPNGERFTKAEERGWTPWPMGRWLCPGCTAGRAGASAPDVGPESPCRCYPDPADHEDHCPQHRTRTPQED